MDRADRISRLTAEIDTAILSSGDKQVIEHREDDAEAIYCQSMDQSRDVTVAELHINGGQHA